MRIKIFLERYKLYLSQLSAQLISGGGLLKCREIVSNFWQVQVHYEHLYEDAAFCSAVLSAEQTFLNGLLQAFDFQLSASMITREELLDFTRSLPNWLCGTVPIGFSHSFLGNLATLYDEFSKVSPICPPPPPSPSLAGADNPFQRVLSLPPDAHAHNPRCHACGHAPTGSRSVSPLPPPHVLYQPHMEAMATETLHNANNMPPRL